MFKITTRDFNNPGRMHYVDITFNGERLPTNGPGLILGWSESEEYLQKVLGPILQEAFDRGEAKGRAAASVREWNRGYEQGVANIRREVEKALSNIPV